MKTLAGLSKGCLTMRPCESGRKGPARLQRPILTNDFRGNLLLNRVLSVGREDVIRCPCQLRMFTPHIRLRCGITQARGGQPWIPTLTSGLKTRLKSRFPRKPIVVIVSLWRHTHPCVYGGASRRRIGAYHAPNFVMGTTSTPSGVLYA